MYEHDEVPDHREEEPGDEEGGGEVEEDPPPAQVDHRCEKIFEVPEEEQTKKDPDIKYWVFFLVPQLYL